MDYYFIVYVFLSIVIIMGTTSTLYNSGRNWAAVLCLVLFILIFVFYGQRWFRGTTIQGTYTGSWPPIINMCPDYLVYFKRGNTETCVDLLGVNRSSGTLQSWSRDDTPANPPQTDAKYFNYVYKPGMNAAQIKQACDAAMQAGLTWEGITNGESCTFQTS